MLRLTEGFTDALLEVLPQRAEALGSALGMQDWVVRTFTEGEVRASLVFQLSKLAALLLVAARAMAGVTPWDTLVAGTAVGTLVEAAALDPAALAGETRPVVLLLRAADGDEEVSAAGVCVRGIVLTQELPHLSHLGARRGRPRGRPLRPPVRMPPPSPAVSARGCCTGGTRAAARPCPHPSRPARPPQACARARSACPL